MMRVPSNIDELGTECTHALYAVEKVLKTLWEKNRRLINDGNEHCESKRDT